MDAYLNLSAADRRIFCEQAAAQMGLPPASIEKDFWVCWTLRELFRLPGWEDCFSFKGGTSLSKAWGLIERFSEDIDIVIDRKFLGFGHEEPSQGQLKKLRGKCSRKIRDELLPALKAEFEKALPQDAPWELRMATKEEDSDEASLIFQYPGEFHETARYLRPAIKIEMGARSDAEPSETVPIRSFLCQEFPEQLGDGAFPVRAVAARRTFIDKFLLLHEENLRAGEKPRKPQLARHYFDVYSLIERGLADEALEDVELFAKVVHHREVFFGYPWMDYSTLKPGSIRIRPSAEDMAGWRGDYDGMRGEMIYGDPPNFDHILDIVGRFEDRFNGSE